MSSLAGHAVGFGDNQLRPGTLIQLQDRFEVPNPAFGLSGLELEQSQIDERAGRRDLGVVPEREDVLRRSRDVPCEQPAGATLRHHRCRVGKRPDGAGFIRSTQAAYWPIRLRLWARLLTAVDRFGWSSRAWR